jgi:transposase
MAKGNPLTEFEKIRIVDCYDKEYAPSLIAEVLGRPLSTITAFYSKYVFNSTLPAKEKVYKGQITNIMGRSIKRIVEEHPKISLRGIEHELRTNAGFVMWVPTYKTIGTYLKRCGYIKKVSWLKPFISEANRVKRLTFARRWITKTNEGYGDSLGCVLWTDETTIRSHPFTRKFSEWKRSGANKAIQEKHHTGRYSVCFWGCISKVGVGPLRVIEGTMDGKQYVKVLKDELFPEVKHLEELDIPVRVMHDNAPCHKSALVNDLLDGYDVEFIDWPPYSPDLNPIENLWAYIKFKLYRDYPPAEDPETLIEYVFEIWEAIDEELCQKYCQNYHKRYLEVIKQKGLQTKY